jgi:hypothetical protein
VASKTVFIRRPCIVEDSPLFMRCMAVHTSRDFMRLLLPEAPLDDLYVDLLDASVALGAG